MRRYTEAVLDVAAPGLTRAREVAALAGAMSLWHLEARRGQHDRLAALADTCDNLVGARGIRALDVNYELRISSNH